MSVSYQLNPIINDLEKAQDRIVDRLFSDNSDHYLLVQEIRNYVAKLYEITGGQFNIAPKDIFNLLTKKYNESSNFGSIIEFYCPSADYTRLFKTVYQLSFPQESPTPPDTTASFGSAR